MPPTPRSARALARIARRRSLKCQWCGRRFTTYHASARYCPGRPCQTEAKAERRRLTGLARRAQAVGYGVLAGEQAKAGSVGASRGIRTARLGTRKEKHP